MKNTPYAVVALLFALSLFAAGFAAPAALPESAPAQEDAPVTVESARDVAALVDEDYAYFAAVSPDGQYVAWGQSSGRRQDRVLQLCLFEFETGGKTCSDLSPEVFLGYPYQFQWSPDSSYIAFSENPVEFSYESDIWLFSVADGAFTNLTEDGLTGGWSSLVADGERVNLDLVPMWNATDGQIYFWRIVPLGNMRFTIGIYRIAPDGDKAELVRDLTADFAAQLPLFDYEELFLDGISAISPDGNAVGVLMTSPNEMGAWEQGLWTIDLADTEAAPQRLAGVDDFRTALPDWAQDFPPQAQGLVWTGDGAGIVVVVNTNAGASMPFQVYYYVDAAGGGVTPVVDFSGLEDWESYSEPAPGSELELPWRAYSPWTGSLSPQGDKLLMVNDLGGVVGLFTAPLPPTGELPAVSASADESPMSGASLSSRAEDGKVVVYGLLLTITEE